MHLILSNTSGLLCADRPFHPSQDASRLFFSSTSQLCMWLKLVERHQSTIRQAEASFCKRSKDLKTIIDFDAMIQ